MFLLFLLSLSIGLSSAVVTYSSGGFSIRIDDLTNGQLPASTIQNQVNYFFQYYPSMQPNYVGAPTTINVTLDPNLASNTVAISPGAISLSGSRLQSNPNDSAYFQFALQAMLGSYSTKSPSTQAPTTKAASSSTNATYVQNGITVKVQDLNSGVPSSTIQSLVNTFFTVYPKEVAYYKPRHTYTNITFFFDPNYVGAARAEINFINGISNMAGAAVRFSADYYKSNPNDVDSLTHEAMHITQFGGATYCPANPLWMTEGGADLARSQFGVNNAGSGWSLPVYSSSQNYTDGYRVTAAFLTYVKQQTNKQPPIENQFFVALQYCNYTTSTTWPSVTGLTVDQWWQKYATASG